jgi:UDP-N-acetylglucosamine 2-epimerase (non-hydrolysing)
MTARLTKRERPRRVMTVFGTRPDAIKTGPIVQAFRTCDEFEPIVVVSGQHREILDQVLDVFDIEPDVDLNISAPGQTLTEITTRTLAGLAPVFAKYVPDLVVVQGDTSTSFAGALGAFYGGVPVAHLEAGLRTGDTHSPYPEEMNRRLVSQLTDLHLAPTTAAKENLLREGVSESSIVVTGNTVIDALRWTIGQPPIAFADPKLSILFESKKKVLLVTAHRRESWGYGMASIGAALAELSTLEPDIVIVVALHPNPVVRRSLVPVLRSNPNVILIEPLPYAEFACLLNRSDIVLTDSGGIQEEAPSLGKPVLVMRETTERPEAIAAGTARLVGTDRDLIVSSVRQLLHEPITYAAMAAAVNPYGDGLASVRTINAFRRFFGEEIDIEEFDPTSFHTSSTATIASTANRSSNR